QKQWTVTQKFGGSDPTVPGNQRLSGNSPIDVATDEMQNNGYLPNQLTFYNGTLGISIIQHSSKGVSLAGAGGGVMAYVPKFLFIAMKDTGTIDVFDLVTRAKVTTLSVPGVTSLSGYWKQ